MAEVKDELTPNEKPEQRDPNYWRSFKDLFKDTSLINSTHNEFGEDVKDDFEPSKLSGMSRRKFLALVGASAALAGAGCSDYRNKGDIIPYNKMPEDVIVGKANHYASTIVIGGREHGVLIKTREGRPIKIDGNPDHPISRGKTNAFTQATIMSLYDPERLQEPMKKGAAGNFVKVDWKKADEDIVNALSKSAGKQVAIVAHSVVSPTGKKAIEEFAKKYPGTKVYSYELYNEEIRNSAWNKCYGSGSFPLIKWNEAKVIVGLEADFLGTEGDRVETARLFAEGNDIHNTDKFNRLYIFEGCLSSTGMNADYRFRLRPDAQYDLVMSLLSEISQKGISVPVNSQILNSFSLDSLAKKYSLNKKNLNLLVKNLIGYKGKGIVYAGRTMTEKVHIAVNVLNEALGNNAMYRTDAVNETLIPHSTKDEWESLISDMSSGNVAVLIHYDSNPVFHLPRDYGYSEALKKVSMVVSLTESSNDSSAPGNYALPINHALESWGDAKTRTGFYSMQQPVIDPIFNSRQKEAALLMWAKGLPLTYDPDMYHKFIMNNWEKNIYPGMKSSLSFKEFWFGGLHDGIIVTDEKPAKIGKLSSSAVSLLDNKSDASDGFLVILRESYQSGDGRFLNNGWMQELPHPMSKITWDNYAAISNSTAKELGVESNDLIEVSVGGAKLKLPAFIQPGAADKTVTIELGYGRKVVGIVGTGVGFDAIPLLTKEEEGNGFIRAANSVVKAGGSYELISSVEHHMFDEELTRNLGKSRGIIREGTVAEFKKNPDFLEAEKPEEIDTLYKLHKYPGVKWAMAVDLNKCIGCGDCVVACNAENNIPIVGKDQVAMSREMQWLRVDRYYSGTIDEPVTSNQLMLCQQCDDAPCENVCPVAATTHSPDGLNQMIYNRCVGTRYCSNNCPYKVRRFNFFNFRDHFKDAYQQSDLLSLVYNPEVTVRSRGVMEKCTFCIQRIMEARSDAIREKRELKGSDVTTACQEACNTNAIKFGDMNDKDSEFYKYRNHELGYYVLEDLNTRPNVTYLAKLRNTETEEV